MSEEYNSQVNPYSNGYVPHEQQPVAAPEAQEQQAYQGGYQQQEGQQYQQQYVQPMQQPLTPPETTKPRSAYVAALLHVLFGIFGFGYFYRGMQDKAKTCLILTIVGFAASFIFGIGMIVVTICQIINIVEAVKLFRGDYPTDAYGRPLLQEFHF